MSSIVFKFRRKSSASIGGAVVHKREGVCSRRERKTVEQLESSRCAAV